MRIAGRTRIGSRAGVRVYAELDRAVSEMQTGDADVASHIIRPCADSLLAPDA